ncbi:MAG: LysR family transcriptional regulator [Burkholderiaceae bacterium]
MTQADRRPPARKLTRHRLALSDDLAPTFDDLVSLRIFARVVESESFSEAARRAGTTPSTVSKRIAALEAQFGTPLFNRTTRSVSVTEAGAKLYERYREVIEILKEASEEISSMDQEVRGQLRVSFPVALGARKIAPAMPAFLKKYPGINLSVDLSFEKVDMLGEHVDIAVRLAESLPDGLIAIRLAPYWHVFCAAPEYLTARGVPQSPEDLAGHDCLVVPGAYGGLTWPMHRPDGLHAVPVNGRLVANHGDAVYDAAIAGLGISMQPRWRVAADLESGRLVEVLSEHVVQKRWIWAVLARRGPMPVRVRLFVDFLREVLADLK